MPGLWVRHDASSAAVVRDNLRASLSLAGMNEDDTYEATLLASELIGNALRHAPPLPSGHLAVHWDVDGEICEIAVTDGGTAAMLSATTPATSAVSGRGLAIVAALAQEWGVASAHSGTTVWAKYHFRARSPHRPPLSRAG